MSNNCTFIGRLAFDAEQRATASGTTVVKFRLASDSGWGEHKKTHWLDVAMFGNRGQALVPHLTKGTQVVIYGELEPPRTYESKGETRMAQSIVARDVTFVGGKSQGGNPQQPNPAPADFDDDLSQLPF